MRFCAACGKELVDSATFCTNCGAPVNPVQPEPVSKAAKILAYISFGLGLFSIIFCWISIVPVSGFMIGIYSFISSLAGIVVSSISLNKGAVKKAKTGLILSIIGLIVTIIFSILSFVSGTALLINDFFDDDFDDDSDYSSSDYDYDFDDDWLDYDN